MHAPNNAKVYSSPTTPADMCPVFSATVAVQPRPVLAAVEDQPAVEAPHRRDLARSGCRPCAAVR